MTRKDSNIYLGVVLLTRTSYQTLDIYKKNANRINKRVRLLIYLGAYIGKALPLGVIESSSPAYNLPGRTSLVGNNIVLNCVGACKTHYKVEMN
jgi:hypothetical protein